VLIGVFVAVTFFDAQAQCPPIPDIPWWGTNEHKKVIDYVNKKHGGDWKPYIAKWTQYQSRMEDVAEREGSVKIRKGDITLSGPELIEYAKKIGQRVGVLHCLASGEGGRGKGVKTASKFTCPDVPDVDWWGDVSHGSMIALVNNKHGGKWRNYIKRWEKELDTLMRRFELGEEVVVNMVGFKLGEEELGLYIGKVPQTLAVTYCLANEVASR
jgi:hypothetical protein